MPPPNISGGLVSEAFLGVDTHSEAAFIVGKSCSPNFLRSGEFLFGYYRFPVAVARIPDNEEGGKAFVRLQDDVSLFLSERVQIRL